MSKKKLTHDQKRKKKLAERAHRTGDQSALAYTGNKYKTDELTPVFFATETAIYEIVVMTDGQLTDHHVRAGLENLVRELRQGPLPPFADLSRPAIDESQYADVIVWNIRRSWEDLFVREGHPGHDNLVGVLRTLLNAISVWGTASKQSRGYLKYLEGFLAKAGVSVRKVSEDDVEEAEQGEDDLLAIGRGWCAGDEEAGEVFREVAERMTDAGEGGKVAEIAQQLIGENVVGTPLKDLSAIAIRAQKAIPPQFRGPSA